MNRYDYSWEAVKVTTEDGGEHTVFHITGKNGYEWFKPTRPEIPVFVMHDGFMDGTSWFQIDQVAFGNSKNPPLPTALYDAGFDVWIGNVRGTEYSPTTDWSFTFDTLVKDNQATIGVIKDKTGREKVNIVAYSLANSVML